MYGLEDYLACLEACVNMYGIQLFCSESNPAVLLSLHQQRRSPSNINNHSTESTNQNLRIGHVACLNRRPKPLNERRTHRHQQWSGGVVCCPPPAPLVQRRAPENVKADSREGCPGNPGPACLSSAHTPAHLETASPPSKLRSVCISGQFGTIPRTKRTNRKNGDMCKREGRERDNSTWMDGWHVPCHAVPRRFSRSPDSRILWEGLVGIDEEANPSADSSNSGVWAGPRGWAHVTFRSGAPPALSVRSQTSQSCRSISILQAWCLCVEKVS